jgi:hypothetical protein
VTPWIYVWHESIPEEGQTAHSTAYDNNPCDSDRTDKEDRRTLPQIIHGQFSSSPELFDDLANNRFIVVALSGWTGEASHKTYRRQNRKRETFA